MQPAADEQRPGKGGFEVAFEKNTTRVFGPPRKGAYSRRQKSHMNHSQELRWLREAVREELAAEPLAKERENRIRRYLDSSVPSLVDEWIESTPRVTVVTLTGRQRREVEERIHGRLYSRRLSAALGLQNRPHETQTGRAGMCEAENIARRCGISGGSASSDAERTPWGPLVRRSWSKCAYEDSFESDLRIEGDRVLRWLVSAAFSGAYRLAKQGDNVAAAAEACGAPPAMVQRTKYGVRGLPPARRIASLRRLSQVAPDFDWAGEYAEWQRKSKGNSRRSTIVQTFAIGSGLLSERPKLVGAGSCPSG